MCSVDELTKKIITVSAHRVHFIICITILLKSSLLDKKFWSVTYDNNICYALFFIKDLIVYTKKYSLLEIFFGKLE